MHPYSLQPLNQHRPRNFPQPSFQHELDAQTSRLATELNFPLSLPSGIQQAEYTYYAPSLEPVPPGDGSSMFGGGAADVTGSSSSSTNLYISPEQATVSYASGISTGFDGGAAQQGAWPQQMQRGSMSASESGFEAGTDISPLGVRSPDDYAWSSEAGSENTGYARAGRARAVVEQGGAKYVPGRSTIDLEPATIVAQPHINKIISQLHAYTEHSVPRPQTIFDDLPPLPDLFTLNEILSLYFEKITCTLAIIHEAAFYQAASRPPSPEQPHIPGHLPPSTGIDPAVLFAMLACAARYHPLYEGRKEVVEHIFYERARRLVLPVIDNPSINVLKTLLHLTLFAVENSLWKPSYMWLGTSVAMARYLGLYKELPALGEDDVTKEGLIGGLAPQQIMAEECRRIWWWVRNYDASGSAASKRPQMISDSEYSKELLLPCPDSLFYATRYGLTPTSPTIPRTQTLDEFYSAVFGADLAHSSIGPNGYIGALTALFNRVTKFRQNCNTINVLPFAVTPETDTHYVLRDFNAHKAELDMWYHKLPGWVKILDSAVKDPADPIVGGGLCWEDQWMRETYEWGIALVIYHAACATLHGPDYNMMAMGVQIAAAGSSGGAGKSTMQPPPHVVHLFAVARLDEVLTAWQGSESFGRALDHAAKGSLLLEEMAGRVPPGKRRDTPFFGYCVCQLVRLCETRGCLIPTIQRSGKSS
ncbi:uncharacterized protein EV422DRAFT_536809 [Fimicolochytrium jonesii]|uniref:uncharacterized protein n=1 Tax=Fimicolochytrium jonesii TaxID=1396493 RepID=UPI0022FE8A87|nr:uncharacterized protein EV422DRAFT_536809 [Fimicolochytrium jonesii]KAI8818777.1 hypothetical protein EV422DRAFT_536809 [Fimicolochytrium jonesii]